MDATTGVFKPLQADDPPVVGGYRLAARLGAGGMGRVYLSHTRGGRPVALKVVRPELAEDPEFRRRFRREVEAARRVRGAYTAELIDADPDAPAPWLATLYVPGPSLTEAVARQGPLPVPAVLWLMAGVAEALRAIHGAGVVHRDMKPSNVLLAADGPRVIDFGISLASGVSSHTATGAMIGTPAFMAPEQASGRPVTAAADVFSLGQTAAFAALGEPLYDGGSHMIVMYRIVHERPDLSLLPAPLRPLLGRCLAADPAERPTPAEVVDWCRGRLGGDGAGTGPSVWHAVTGPEVVVPEPVPHPTPVQDVPVQDPWAAPRRVPASPGPEPRPPRRRRTALLTAGAVAAAAVLVAGLVWTVVDAGDRFGAAGGSPSPSQSQSRSQSRSPSAAPSASGPRRPVPFPLQWLDARTSVDFKRPEGREDRSGDIRFTCGGEHSVGCALESDSSVFAMHHVEEGATLATCRAALDVAGALRAKAAEGRTLPLAGAAVGSQICVRHPSGDVALLVVQAKSTALPKSGNSFVTLEMSVWRQS
ncbi:serine/threonine-protein kinase [Streptomyces sp. NPDC012888]|uniref:serine/threonine-protein kinase n=1 Tax=Streptomyces sp. NPDC012888 TaxID=3364855 RepID=UPI00367ADABB